MRRFLLVVVVVLLVKLGFSAVAVGSYTIEPNIWRYRGHPIAYERAYVVEECFHHEGGDNSSSSTTHSNKTANRKAPVLLLNGFGVGSFHQHRLIGELLTKAEHEDRLLYCIDYLGQGASWPEDCNDGLSQSEEGLRYCGNTWVDQLTTFIEKVILSEKVLGDDDKCTTKNLRKVHIVGNSLGGHLAVFIAAKRPELVESISLLNPTPVWGLNLPGWSGHLPAPRIPKLIARYLFDRIRDPETIREFLLTTYANPAALDERLMEQIRDCTEGKGGHAAFASILWSPPVTVTLPSSTRSQTSPSTAGVGITSASGADRTANFYQCLQALECDVLLIFGRDDPWCKPAFARRFLRELSKRPWPERVQRYVELSNVGHCPNNESPNAVAGLVTRWLDATDRRPGILPLPSSESVRESWGDTVARERKEKDIPLSWTDRLAIRFI